MRESDPTGRLASLLTGLLLTLFATGMVFSRVAAEEPPAAPVNQSPQASESASTDDSEESEKNNPAEEEIEPWSGDRARRPAAGGEWRPTLLLPNDLTDPPQNYPHCPGGACVGMTAMTNALWACPVERGWYPAKEFVRRVIHAMLPDARGNYSNPTLRSQVMLNDRLLTYDDPRVLRFVVESIQRRIQPLSGKPTPVAEIRSQYREVLRVPGRLDTATELRNAVEAAGGRIVVGLLFYNRDLTAKAGHAAILTLDSNGELFVWDPNARMDSDAIGSGRLAKLDISETSDGRIREVSYQIELPDGTEQQRSFNFVFPVRSLIDPRTIPAPPAAER